MQQKNERSFYQDPSGLILETVGLAELSAEQMRNILGEDGAYFLRPVNGNCSTVVKVSEYDLADYDQLG
jgi:hypothetical protein